MRDAGLRLLLALQRSIVTLPWRVQRGIGRALGAMIFHFARRRRAIAVRNLELCFPGLSAEQRQHLLRRHFAELGIGLVELGFAWYAADARIRKFGTISGIEYVEGARAAGRGVMLISGHFTTLDFAGRLLGQTLDYAAVYRPLGIPAVDRAVHAGRSRATSLVFPKSDIRQALEILRGQGCLWLMIDQADTSAKAVDAPFFGVDAATTVTPARLARSSGCAVVPVYTTRMDNGQHMLEIQAPLADFPTDDSRQDAASLNAVIESHVRRNTAQYYWIHRRFKSRQSDHYADIE